MIQFESKFRKGRFDSIIISDLRGWNKRLVALPWSLMLANYGLLDLDLHQDPKRVHIGPGHTSGATIKASLDDLEGA